MKVSRERPQDTPKGVIAVYDNGGRSVDRFTIVFDPKCYGLVRHPGVYPLLSCSYNPDDWPLGVFQRREGPLGPHLGRSIAFTDLPKRVQKHVINYLHHLDVKL